VYLYPSPTSSSPFISSPLYSFLLHHHLLFLNPSSQVPRCIVPLFVPLAQAPSTRLVKSALFSLRNKTSMKGEVAQELVNNCSISRTFLHLSLSFSEFAHPPHPPLSVVISCFHFLPSLPFPSFSSLSTRQTPRVMTSLLCSGTEPMNPLI
jgi:hypothetical protein